VLPTISRIAHSLVDPGELNRAGRAQSAVLTVSTDVSGIVDQIPVSEGEQGSNGPTSPVRNSSPSSLGFGPGSTRTSTAEVTAPAAVPLRR
jgi:hypothetical protein